MKECQTYKNFESAKIENPGVDVYAVSLPCGDVFTCYRDVLEVYPDAKRCNPADHCMTVEKFLADGHKFVEGDVYLDDDGSVVTVKSYSICLDNQPVPCDYTRFILRAEALEEKSKRVKVEFVNAGFSREWKAVRYYNEVGELFVVDCNGNYTNVNDISGNWYEVVCKNYDSLFIRVETEIDERQEFIKRAEELIDISKIAEYSLGRMYDAGCRFKLVNDK
ncbi:lipocalin family protein [Vibrio phage 1.135.O._10N.222.54.B6]|nr:lipocalin family protein [Vibrio phage 1.135.O._10N.222.54.B6]